MDTVNSYSHFPNLLPSFTFDLIANFNEFLGFVSSVWLLLPVSVLSSKADSDIMVGMGFPLSWSSETSACDTNVGNCPGST